jgi:hypothetical protein
LLWKGLWIWSMGWGCRLRSWLGEGFGHFRDNILPTYTFLLFGGIYTTGFGVDLAVFAWTGGWLHRLVLPQWDNKRAIGAHRSRGNTKRFAAFLFRPSVRRPALRQQTASLRLTSVLTLSRLPSQCQSPVEGNSRIKMYNPIPSRVPNARTRGFYGRFPSWGISTTHPSIRRPPCSHPKCIVSIFLCRPITRVHVTVQPAQLNCPFPISIQPNPRPLVVVLVRHKKVLVQAVARKGDRRDTQPGEGAFEPVEAAEAARVAPRLAVEWVNYAR